jgi:transposase
MPVLYQELPGNIPDLRTVELLHKLLEHAGCPEATWLTDRGYPTQSVLDFLLWKGLPFICCIKSSSSIVSSLIESIRDGRLAMEINVETRNYELQQEVTYYYEHRSGKGRKAARLKANIFFDSVRKSVGERDLDVAIKEQRLLLEDLKEQQLVISDEQDLKRDCPYYSIAIDTAGVVQSFAINEKRVSAKKRVMGYIVMLSNKLELDASQVWETYGLRDEQEKYFADMKGAMLDDRNPAWSEKGKEGRLFIHFVGLSVYSHLKHVWKRLALKDQFETVDTVIDEMKSIRCIEHKGKAKIITPFVGKQLKICEYYGLEVPPGCAPKVKGISSKTGRRNKKASQD